MGGGSVAITTKFMELLAQVQDLKRVLEQRDSSQSAKLDNRTQLQLRPLLFGSAGHNSSFPFAYSRNRSFKPIIPTGLLQRIVLTDNLASQGDEVSEFVSLV